MDQPKALGLFILSLIFLCSCHSQNNTYTGKSIQLDYSHVEKLKDDSWISIDDWQFRHIRDQQKAATITFSLPTTTVVFDSLETGRALRSKTTPNTIPLYLAKYLRIINTTDSLSGLQKSKYNVTDPSFASATGKIQISKSDSSTISVSTSAGYPAEIKVLEK